MVSGATQQDGGVVARAKRFAARFAVTLPVRCEPRVRRYMENQRMLHATMTVLGFQLFLQSEQQGHISLRVACLVQLL